MRIRELREDLHLRQRDVAQAIQTSQTNIGRWENEVNEPSASFIIKLADFFAVSADYLLGRTDEMGTVVMSGHASQLSADEREVLSLYESLSPSRKEDLRIYLRALSSAGVKSEKKKA